MPKSKAFLQFEGSIKMAEELLIIESGYHDPPRRNEQKAVLGLRGGAVILIVASFENFLKQMFVEHLMELNPLKAPFSKLPESLQVNCVYLTLDYAMKGSRFQQSVPRVQRLPEINKACSMLVSGTFNPEVFSDTGGNPNHNTVKEMFKNVGISSIFEKVKNEFEHKWGQPVANLFIEGKLDEIVQRRHKVAHTADVLNITRADLKESIIFLKILANLLDIELKNHVRQILK